MLSSNEISTPKTILLVDDDPFCILILGKVLRDAGFEVIAVKDGLEALKILKCRLVDALITDFQMPRVNGRQLAMAARSMPEYKEVPIFIISDYIHCSSYSRISNTYYLPKPVDKVYLIAEINKRFSQVNQLNQLRIEPVLLEALVQSTQETMTCFGVENLVCEENPVRYSDISSNSYISSTINLNINPSNAHQMVLSFSRKCYLLMVSTMIGQEQSQLSQKDFDGIADITTMILNNAQSHLAHRKLDTSPTTIIVGDNHRLYSQENGLGIQHKYKSPNIEFDTFLL